MMSPIWVYLLLPRDVCISPLQVLEMYKVSLASGFFCHRSVCSNCEDIPEERCLLLALMEKAPLCTGSRTWPLRWYTSQSLWSLPVWHPAIILEVLKIFDEAWGGHKRGEGQLCQPRLPIIPIYMASASWRYSQLSYSWLWTPKTYSLEGSCLSTNKKIADHSSAGLLLLLLMSAKSAALIEMPL